MVWIIGGLWLYVAGAILMATVLETSERLPPQGMWYPLAVTFWFVAVLWAIVEVIAEDVMDRVGKGDQ